MSKVDFPAPYQIQAAYRQNRNAYPIVIADTLEVDIRDVSKEDTSLVATLDMTWMTGGLPGQGSAKWHPTDFVFDNKRNPKVEIRRFENDLYVPIMKFSLSEASPATAASIADLAAPINAQTALYCPLHAFYDVAEPEYKEWLFKQATGALPRFHEASIKRVSEYGNLRSEAEENAKAVAADVILLDGLLWQRLKTEPRITFKRELKIVDDERAEAVMTFRVTLGQIQDNDPLTSGDFSLTRFGDCREHVREHFPDIEHVMLFENLNLLDESAFAFSGETDALIRAAQQIQTVLEKDQYYLTPQALELANKLKWELKSGNADEIVGVITETLPHLELWPKVSNGAKAAIDRWHMRPLGLERGRQP